jgi:hypothetical protein
MIGEPILEKIKKLNFDVVNFVKFNFTKVVFCCQKLLFLEKLQKAKTS